VVCGGMVEKRIESKSLILIIKYGILFFEPYYDRPTESNPHGE